MQTTDEMIESMVAAMYPDEDQERARHITRETLRSLVRLGQTEQMAAMRAQVSTIVNAPSTRH